MSRSYNSASNVSLSLNDILINSKIVAVKTVKIKPTVKIKIPEAYNSNALLIMHMH